MGRINFDDVVILGQKTNQILIWNGKEARWKNISDIESERLRKERKETKKENEASPHSLIFRPHQTILSAKEFAKMISYLSTRAQYNGGLENCSSQKGISCPRKSR